MKKTMTDILRKARENGYGVAAPNVWSWETIRIVFETANELNAPVIIDVAPVHGIEECAYMVGYFEHKYPNVEFALNLDHGSTFDECVKAIRCGFSSVMVDRSMFPFERNVEEVKEIVKIAHSVGVSVEAELGHVGQGYEYEQTRDAGLTRKEEAVEYVKQTEVDCLAVSVGTSHGTYKGTPKLEFDLLNDLHNLVQVPLVLHGGSGTGDDNLEKAVLMGIQKVNLCTDLSNGALDKMIDILGDNYQNIQKSGAWMCDLTNEMVKGYKEQLIHYIKLFHSEGKANRG